MPSSIRNRHTIRLPGYDYTQPGAYFVTIVTQDRINRFGEIQNGNMVINKIGCIIQTCWLDLPHRFPGIELDEYVIMPNHFHGIIFITENMAGAMDTPVSRRGSPCGCPAPGQTDQGVGTSPTPTKQINLGDIVGAFKSITTDQYIAGVHQSGWPPFHRRLWQRNYYEHIVRNEAEWQKIRQYIRNNPLQWELDIENPSP